VAPPVVNPAIAAAMQPTGPTGFPGASGTPQYPNQQNTGLPSAPPATSSAATPGISGAIIDAVRALGQALAPKSITQQAALEKMREQKAGIQNAPPGGAIQPAPGSQLGNQFGPTGGLANP
jgi:hypothetical protein